MINLQPWSFAFRLGSWGLNIIGTGMTNDSEGSLRSGALSPASAQLGYTPAGHTPTPPKAQ